MNRLSATDILGSRFTSVDGADPQLLGMGGIFGRNSTAFQPDSAAIGMVNAGQRFDQRRFSGAVFAQQGHDFAAPQAKVDVIQRLNAGEEFTKSFGAKDLRCASALIIDVTFK